VVNGRRSTEVICAFRRPGFYRPEITERRAARRDPAFLGSELAAPRAANPVTLERVETLQDMSE
jgi:hypothetical protein